MGFAKVHLTSFYYQNDTQWRYYYYMCKKSMKRVKKLCVKLTTSLFLRLQMWQKVENLYIRPWRLFIFTNVTKYQFIECKTHTGHVSKLMTSSLVIINCQRMVLMHFLTLYHVFIIRFMGGQLLKVYRQKLGEKSIKLMVSSLSLFLSLNLFIMNFSLNFLCSKEVFITRSIVPFNKLILLTEPLPRLQKDRYTDICIVISDLRFFISDAVAKSCSWHLVIFLTI